ncbi:hypothetical protein MHYP_G00337030 [Metynnis hypsauchen]
MCGVKRAQPRPASAPLPLGCGGAGGREERPWRATPARRSLWSERETPTSMEDPARGEVPTPEYNTFTSRSISLSTALWSPNDCQKTVDRDSSQMDVIFPERDSMSSMVTRNTVTTEQTKCRRSL